MSYYSKLAECDFQMHYANGKVKKNGNKLELDGDSGFSKICLGLQPLAAMYQDKKFGLLCVNCHTKLYPKKRKKWIAAKVNAISTKTTAVSNSHIPKAVNAVLSAMLISISWLETNVLVVV